MIKKLNRGCINALLKYYFYISLEIEKKWIKYLLHEFLLLIVWNFWQKNYLLKILWISNY